jgi:hypothetical protein
MRNLDQFYLLIKPVTLKVVHYFEILYLTFYLCKLRGTQLNVRTVHCLIAYNRPTLCTDYHSFI